MYMFCVLNTTFTVSTEYRNTYNLDYSNRRSIYQPWVNDKNGLLTAGTHIISEICSCSRNFPVCS